MIIIALSLLATACNTKVDDSALADVEYNLSAANEMIASLEAKLEESNTAIDSLENKVIEKENDIDEFEEKISILMEDLEEDEMQIGPTPGNSLINEALVVMDLIAAEDFASLDSHISPANGLRFSPYSNINTSTDIVLYAGNSISTMLTNTTVYIWGSYDGSGDSISNDGLGYFNEFVYDHAFANPPMIGINTTIGSGNMINNFSTSYPGDSFVEFHFTGFDPQYSGMDYLRVSNSSSISPIISSIRSSMVIIPVRVPSSFVIKAI